MARTTKAAREQAGAASNTDELGLLPGEVPEEVAAFAEAMRDRVRPCDVLEEIWLEDHVSLALEVRRLRRLKRQMIEAARPEGLQDLLQPIVGTMEAMRLKERWCDGDTTAAREINEALRPSGLSFDHVNAKAFELRIAEIEKLDHMLVRAEARRNNALHEIADHRDGFAVQLNAAAEAAGAGAAVPALAAPRTGGGDG